MGHNGWDYAPLVSDIRQIIRGIQTAKNTSQLPSFMNQEKASQSWHDNCYGQCHYPDYIDPEPGTLMGGSKPETPLVDTFSSGMGETASGFVSIAQTVIIGKTMRNDLPEPKIDTPRFGIRIAPFGNAGDGPLASQLPHFHFRVGPQLGKSFDGLGWKWHHPWDDFSRFFGLFK